MKVLYFHTENALHIFLLIKKAYDKYKKKKVHNLPTLKEEKCNCFNQQKNALLNDSMSEINRGDLFFTGGKGKE